MPLAWAGCPCAPRRATGSEVVAVRSAAAAIVMLSALALGSFAAAACGGRVSAARSVPGDPPRAPQDVVEAASAHVGFASISASLGGAVEVADAESSLAGARIDLPPGALRADATVAIDAGDDGTFPMFPDLTIVRATAAAPLLKPVHIRIPYSEALLAHWNVTDERQLVLYTRDDDGLWGALTASVDPAHNVIEANVDRLTSWVVAPGWMLTAWQRRALIGGTLTPGKRNVLLVHGWNSSPWDGCELRLAAGLRETYDNVAAYAYPSALDIGENAVWLRDAIRTRYPNVAFDIVGFSEGGLVARAALEPGVWNGGQTIAASVRNLITIATPHLGVLSDTGPSLLSDTASSEMVAGSPFLRDLNTHPETGGVRYGLIAGAGWRVTSDGLVGVDSALGRGTLVPYRTATLPSVHASGGTGGMPCDQRVYDAIRTWVP